MISCSCDTDSYAWIGVHAEDFSKLDTVRGRRCYSCKKLMPVGSEVLAFYRYRDPRGDYEERRFGDEVPMSSIYYCQKCGEIFLNLSATGLCVEIGDMREALREYWKMTGFDPVKYQSTEPTP